MSYSSNGNRPKLTEKGLLTPDNCVVAFAKLLSGDNNFDLGFRKNKTIRGFTPSESPEGYALRATLHFGRSRAITGVRERRCGVTSAHWNTQATAQPSCEETLSDQTRRDSRFRSRSSRSTQDRLYRQYKKEK